MNNRLLEKLEWPLLLNILAGFSQTEEGYARLLQLPLDLDKESIHASWEVLSSIQALLVKGFCPPIGDVKPLGMLLKQASLGQILEGEAVKDVLLLLKATARVKSFCKEHTPKCAYLEPYALGLDPLPELLKLITKTIHDDGSLKDDASKELVSIRRHKIILKQRIEQKLKSFISQQDIAKYVHDEFITTRYDRYVIPLSIDGHGRMMGTVVDTSSSGQTLFVEPAIIRPMNEELAKLDLDERLEIIRLLKELTRSIALKKDELTVNYDLILKLDGETAKAQLAKKLDAQKVNLVFDKNILDLKGARHPLLEKPIANNLYLDEEKRCLVISGPNAGGKTVALKSAGLIVLMAKAGLLLPCEESSFVSLFSQVHLSMGDSQSLEASLSTFSGHIQGLVPILNEAQKGHLVLLDELCVGTEPHTGACLAQAMLETLVARGAFIIITTHFDDLKVLAFNSGTFRNASMEYELSTLKPTYRLVLDVPGESYGLEVSVTNGVQESIIQRARFLRGQAKTCLDEAVSRLNQSTQETNKIKKELELSLHGSMSSQAKWDQELRLLEEHKKSLLLKLKEKWDDEFSDIKRSYLESVDEFQKSVKNLPATIDRWMVHASIEEEKRKVESQIENAHKKLQSVEDSYLFTKDHSKGFKVDFEVSNLKLGQKVYYPKINKEGVLKSLPLKKTDKCQVLFGSMVMLVPFSDLKVF